jgi:hypothetical protein
MNSWRPSYQFVCKLINCKRKQNGGRLEIALQKLYRYKIFDNFSNGEEHSCAQKNCNHCLNCKLLFGITQL